MGLGEFCAAFAVDERCALGRADCPSLGGRLVGLRRDGAQLRHPRPELHCVGRGGGVLDGALARHPYRLGRTALGVWLVQAV